MLMSVEKVDTACNVADSVYVSGAEMLWAVTSVVAEMTLLDTLVMSDVVVSRKTVDCG